MTERNDNTGWGEVSWREVLRDFIRRSARDDYAWNRVNQRHLTRSFILPALHSERMGRLVCAVDTSGSIDHEILAEFQAEVQAALDELRPEAVEIIVCDAKVHATQRFEPSDEVRIDAKGGGGTDFRPVFGADRRGPRRGARDKRRPDIGGEMEQDEPPAAVVYFTDLQGIQDRDQQRGLRHTGFQKYDRPLRLCCRTDQRGKDRW